MVVYGRLARAPAERHPVFFRRGPTLYLGDVLKFTENSLDGLARFRPASHASAQPRSPMSNAVEKASPITFSISSAMILLMSSEQ